MGPFRRSRRTLRLQTPESRCRLSDDLCLLGLSRLWDTWKWAIRNPSTEGLDLLLRELSEVLSICLAGFCRFVLISWPG